MGALKASAFLTGQTANNPIADGGTVKSVATDPKFITDDNLQSVPQMTKRTHVIWGDFAGAVLTIYASLDQTHWFTLTGWNVTDVADAQATHAVQTDGVFPYWDHVVSGAAANTNLKSAIH